MRTLRLLIVVTLFGLVAQPAAADDSGTPQLPGVAGSSQWDGSLPGSVSNDALAARLEPSSQWNGVGAGQPVTPRLPDEPTGWMHPVVQVALGLLMLVLVLAGFAIAVTSLRADIRQRRVDYRRRERI